MDSFDKHFNRVARFTWIMAVLAALFQCLVCVALGIGIYFCTTYFVGAGNGQELRTVEEGKHELTQDEYELTQPTQPSGQGLDGVQIQTGIH